MKKAIIPIILGAFLLFTFIAPSMTAETDIANSDQAVSTKTEGSLKIPIPRTLLVLSTGVIGLIALTRKTRPRASEIVLR